jgi:hypothetical protein
LELVSNVNVSRQVFIFIFLMTWTRQLSMVYLLVVPSLSDNHFNVHRQVYHFRCILSGNHLYISWQVWLTTLMRLLDLR